MGRASRSGRRQRATSRRTGRPATGRARARTVGARRRAGTPQCVEMTGAMDAATLAALELEVRDVARRYGAEIADFRVEVRRRSG